MHLEHLEQKLNSSIITIKRIKKFIPKEHYSKLYHTLFVSHLTYGISAWGSSSANGLKKIFSIQKRCVRLLFGKKFNFDHAEFYKTCARARPIDDHVAPKNYVLEHTKPLFKDYKLLTIHNLHKLFLLNEIFKIQKYKTPISLSTFLYKISDQSRLCRKENLAVPNYRLNVSRNQFIYCGTTTWNNVNSKIYKSSAHSEQLQLTYTGLDIFSDLSVPVSSVKRKLKNILLDIQFTGDSNNWEKQNFHI